MKKSRHAYEEWLNELEVPEDGRRCNGGRIPDRVTLWGTWLRVHDPIAFNVGYNEWENR